MPDRPHIVFITADQMRFDCLACHGNLGVRTPHLDALARESVIFDHAYCSTPLCVPTRTSIGTGQWPHTTRTIINSNRRNEQEFEWGLLGAEHATFYERLAEAGYDVRHVGIQHIHSHPPLEARVPGATIISTADHEAYLERLGLPPNYHGFPPHAGIPPAGPILDFDNGRTVVKENWASARYAAPFPYEAQHFKDFYFTRAMEEQIGRADPGRPSAFVFQAWAPHPPFFAPEPYFSLYDPAAIRLPENVGRWYPGMPPTVMLGTGGQRGFPLEREEWRRLWAVYFGLVTLADDCIGRVIAALKARGIWDNALVVFTMDHGESLGSHRMFEKMTMYEESAHVPLFVKPPGGLATGRRRQMVGHVDLAPTLCDYAGVGPLTGAWGRSLRATVENPAAAWREATFAEFNGDQARAYPSRAIFTERHKYIFHFSGGEELYDLQDDPQETRSLAGDPGHAAVKAELRGRLGQWMRETDDILDLERDAGFTPAGWATIQRSV
jgi:arylsulfatase A-like enzyme